MSKATEPFKKIISDHLKERAEQDPLFAITFKKESKSIEDCINYIFSEVQKSGCQGFADDEVFAMAVHYYDEDDIAKPKAINGKVVVNHTIGKPKEKEKQIVVPLGGRDTSKTNPKKPTMKVVKQPVLANQTSLF